MPETVTPPVLLLIYKRISTARLVVNQLRKVEPPLLFISANGPNLKKKGDLEKCREARTIVNEIDWNCEVITNFREDHLDAKHSITSGISWFFDNVDEGVILEDDCVIDPTFYTMAGALLKYYRHNERIMHIGASNFQSGIKRGPGSYYFSRYNHIWGWAGWKRSWRDFNVDISHVSKVTFKDILQKIFSRPDVRKYWMEILRYLQSGKIDTWDTQYMFHLWMKDGIAVTPNVNMVTNAGFGIDATNTQVENSVWSKLESKSMDLISHPTSNQIDHEADDFTSDHFFGIKKSARYFHLKIIIPRIMPLFLKNGIKRIIS